MILAEPIVWLLFERGAFTESETLKTVQVLIMYMIAYARFATIFPLRLND